MDTASQTFLLRNARIVTTGRVVERGSVLLANGKIERLAESQSSEKLRADSELDLSGLTLFPGFIDLHIHGAVGVDATTASAADLGKVSRHLALNGVTAWLPTLVPSRTERYQGAVEAISAAMLAQPEAVTARILGVHYEGPFVNSDQCGALRQEHFRTYGGTSDLDAIPKITNQNAVQMMTLAPEIAGGLELVDDLNRRGWVISLGHTQAGLEVLDKAFALGARHMTHFFNAMPPLHHRNPGPVGWGMTSDIFCDVIADGIHVDPLMLKLLINSKSAERVSLISDAIAPAGLGDGEYQVWDETIAVENRRTQNARGGIAGSVITMLDAVRMMLALGFSAPAVARMAALNPARLLDLNDEVGSIEEGKRADLVALDSAAKVQLTVVGGSVLMTDQQLMMTSRT